MSVEARHAVLRAARGASTKNSAASSSHSTLAAPRSSHRTSAPNMRSPCHAPAESPVGRGLRCVDAPMGAPGAPQGLGLWGACDLVTKERQGKRPPPALAVEHSCTGQFVVVAFVAAMPPGCRPDGPLATSFPLFTHRAVHYSPLRFSASSGTSTQVLRLTRRRCPPHVPEMSSGRRLSMWSTRYVGWRHLLEPPEPPSWL